MRRAICMWPIRATTWCGEVATDGTITRLAGNGNAGFGGDGGAATSAQLNSPQGWRWTRPATYTSPTAEFAGAAGRGERRHFARWRGTARRVSAATAAPRPAQFNTPTASGGGRGGQPVHRGLQQQSHSQGVRRRDHHARWRATARRVTRAMAGARDERAAEPAAGRGGGCGGQRLHCGHGQQRGPPVGATVRSPRSRATGCGGYSGDGGTGGRMRSSGNPSGHSGGRRREPVRERTAARGCAKYSRTDSSRRSPATARRATRATAERRLRAAERAVGRWRSDSAGNVYVADTGNNAVRLAAAAGAGTSLADGGERREQQGTAAIAPGEVVVLYGSGMGPATLAKSKLNSAGQVPATTWRAPRLLQ